VGCPVVATAVGGVLDTVRDNETGLLVPDGDAKALADALGRLLDDAALRRRLAEQARRLADREFSVKGMVDQYEAVYESVVARRRAELSPRRA
jgi:glycosyltransferase involved in cell wall biosynthesis